MIGQHQLIKLTILASIFVLLLWPMSSAVAQPPHQTVGPTVVDLTFFDLGFYEDRVLRGDGDFAAYALYMPQNFQLSAESYVEVVFSYLILGGTRPAELKVALNNISLGSTSFLQEGEPTKSEEHRLRLPLAETALHAGRNRLGITLETHEICDVYEPEVEVIIYATSTFHLVYDTPPLTPDLQAYPYPFYERTFWPSEVYIVLPEETSAADLSAAATVSAGLGRLAGLEARLAISSTLDSAVTSQIQNNYHLIVIGQSGRNRLLDQLSLPLDKQATEVKPDDGVLQVVPSPWNPARAVLVVTGQSDTALYRASAALNRPSFLPGLRGQVSIVKDVLPPPSAATARPAVDRTFDSLGYEDETLYGVEANQARYYFYLPRTWDVLESPRLSLSFSHSSIIDPANSTLDVYVNNVPIGGTSLNETNQTDGWLELELPYWLLRPGQNRLYIEVQMHFLNEHCPDKNDPRAWTVIFKNSYLYLPLVAGQEEPDLAFFPSPFDGNGHYEETVFVVSKEVTNGQRDALLRLAAYLGVSSGSDYLALQVVRDSELSEEVKTQKHLILLGRPTQNLLLQEQAVADALPQPFEPGTDILLPRHDTIVVQQIPGWSIGLLQEFPSVWNPQRTMLAVTGTTDKSIERSLEALTSSSQSLAGNLVVVEADGTLRTVRVREEYARQMPSARTNSVRVGEDVKRLLSLAEKWW